ncbi:MAG: YjiH family protein [Firmicutes bacterium]|jgi:nucleoside recognition membrane protein YjiH|nr:YjiH family protein [Bacillota bacterium]
MNKLKFIFLSIFGFVFFLVPFELMGEEKIAISHIVKFITGNMLDGFISFTMICSWIVLLGTIIFMIYTSKNQYLNGVFKASPINRFMRIGGSFLYLMVLNKWFEGSKFVEKILDPNTGGVMAGDGGLLTTLYITFFVGLMALPLLTHFGAVEFIGIMFGRIVEKLFKVPGYSAVDAIASFVGDGTIGIVVTDTQYQRGYYNKREAYIIATSFSIVGIAFASAVAEELGFSHIFPIFYGAIVLVTVILAFITSRMPLKKFPAKYYEGVTPNRIEIPEGKTVLQHAYDSAVEEASKAKILDVIKQSFKSVIDIYVGFLPIIMFVGTLSLIVAEHTQFFNIISAPLVSVYQVIGYSKEVASMMAPASVVGFADMYLPSLFITESVSEASRFFIGVLAFTQLVFMSETGMVLVKSKIGLNFFDVVKIFIYRTLLSLPILLLVTKLLVYMGMLTY